MPVGVGLVEREVEILYERFHSGMFSTNFVDDFALGFVGLFWCSSHDIYVHTHKVVLQIVAQRVNNVLLELVDNGFLPLVDID